MGSPGTVINSDIAYTETPDNTGFMDAPAAIQPVPLVLVEPTINVPLGSPSLKLVCPKPFVNVPVQTSVFTGNLSLCGLEKVTVILLHRYL